MDLRHVMKELLSCLRLQLNEFLQLSIRKKLVYSVRLGYCAPDLNLLFKLNSFFSLAIYSPGIHNGTKKS